MTISVVIPVRNGAATLERCLNSLLEQTLPPHEIIITDTASTDNSKAIAEKYGAVVIDIAEKDFDHGLTRNEAARHCSGDLVYCTVQDAWIAGNDMLERMARHFDDPEVMAVSGHQAVPHEKDKNPVRWYRRYSAHAVEERQIADRDRFLAMTQHDQQKLVAWDNVVAMYRMSALQQLPFVQTAMSEDWMWSYQALMKGWKLLRDSSLLVYHYHHQTKDYVFSTNYSVNYHFHKFFGCRPDVPEVAVPFLKALYHLLQQRDLSFSEKMYWISHNLHALQAEKASAIEFLTRLKKGEAAVEEGYGRYCREIPMGRQQARRNLQG